MKSQLHLGTLGKKDCYGKRGAFWHSDDGGKTYWSGAWYRRTPKQLKEEAESVLRDLRKSNPRLFKGNSPLARQRVTKTTQDS